MAKREWCSGSVGMLGISYHASSQWRAANMQPPSLKAIMPWEGRADQYRDQAYHGGIFAMGFIGNWWLTHTAHHLLGRPRSYNPEAFHNNLGDPAYGLFFGQRGRHFTADFDVIF